MKLRFVGIEKDLARILIHIYTYKFEASILGVKN